MGACNSTFLGPARHGALGSNIIKFQLQSQFQRFFLYQTVCVLTNISHRIFILSPGSYLRGQKFNCSEHGHVAYYGKRIILLKFTLHSQTVGLKGGSSVERLFLD